jgi:hypothetical protein
MNKLQGKKVLLISPKFFGYEAEIERELVNLGAAVDFYDERPFSSSVAKIANRLNFKFFIKKRIKQHYAEILEQALTRQYDFMLVISPETMDINFVRCFKASCPNAKTVLYLWDSIVNKKNVRFLLEAFDKAVTFDPNDAAVDARVYFLPLFYISRYDRPAIEMRDDVNNIYNVAFIGTAHSDRYAIVNKVLTGIRASTLSNFIYFYSPSKLLFFMKKLLSSELKGISYSEVSFNSLSSQQIADVFLRTNVVVDIEHPKQNGLTMRTIEMLGLQKKLITTNKNVMSYDFYHPNNICVVEREHPVIKQSFIDCNYQPVDESIRTKYSLSQWLSGLLG